MLPNVLAMRLKHSASQVLAWASVEIRSIQSVSVPAFQCTGASYLQKSRVTWTLWSVSNHTHRIGWTALCLYTRSYSASLWWHWRSAGFRQVTSKRRSSVYLDAISTILVFSYDFLLALCKPLREPLHRPWTREGTTHIDSFRYVSVKRSSHSYQGMGLSSPLPSRGEVLGKKRSEI